MTLNNGQKLALEKINIFLNSDKRIFILKGYAGTGKTTILKELIGRYENDNNFIALATTGAASKVLSSKINSVVSTVHSEVYKYKETQKTKDEYNYIFEIRNRLQSADKRNVYIVDEASMIGNDPAEQENRVSFGSNKSLQDFLQKTLSENKNSKIIFVGDPMQLPPVGSTKSVALDKESLKKIFNVECLEATLTEIMRQNYGNTIQEESIKLRECFENKKEYILKPDNKNIFGINYNYIPNFYSKYEDVGIITHSNRKALAISQKIREIHFGKSPKEIEIGDKLLVVFNNHKINLMNGELVKVKFILEKYSKDISLNYEDKEKNKTITLKFVKAIIENEKKQGITTWILLNFLNDSEYKTNEPYISDALSKLAEQLNQDPYECIYFNALRVRYGYAITCHKSQGSEFDIVILENRKIKEEEESYKWVYTGMTRAKNKLYLFDPQSVYDYSGNKLEETRSTLELQTEKMIVKKEEENNSTKKQKMKKTLSIKLPKEKIKKGNDKKYFFDIKLPKEKAKKENDKKYTFKIKL